MRTLAQVNTHVKVNKNSSSSFALKNNNLNNFNRNGQNLTTLNNSQKRLSSSNLSSQECIDLEYKHGAHNYHPLPVVFSKAKGAEVWDPEGKRYYDFLSAYSAVNQGHCHPKIVGAMTEQAQKLTLSARAFHNDQLGPFCKYITEYFGYDMVLPMNTGAEAVETAMKLARKWGYQKKGIPKDKGIILSASGCFHGRTLGVISMSDDPGAVEGFGPFVPGLQKVEYDNVADLKQKLEQHGDHVCGFLVEPIQGEAGVVTPDASYIKECAELCKQYNVPLIGDEIQTGIARTGRMLCSEWSDVRPDIVILGKAVSGGVYPVSAVLADEHIMLCIQPGEHGSTFGGNPVACATARAALEVVKEENLVEHADKLGEKFRTALRELNSNLITQVRGRGLLNAIVINSDDHNVHHGKSAWDVCMGFKERGLLAKPTQGDVIRLAPPLVISEKQIDEGIDIISSTIKDVEAGRM
eukprot:gb/GECH01012526.1/.p1 GENE.gb/GECH01012526.1/~~gb/GECH01012526.1/.p1  ORF type:complete len:467 (+),score=110.84 gb/GECH01012526.1/:1-1401(+)